MNTSFFKKDVPRVAEPGWLGWFTFAECCLRDKKRILAGGCYFFAA
jgi:hypothetical protein